MTEEEKEAKREYQRIYQREYRKLMLERMTEEEEKLLGIINQKLGEANLHLRLRIIKIHSDGSISTEYEPPVHKWIKEDAQATSIVLEEMAKYQAR